MSGVFEVQGAGFTALYDRFEGKNTLSELDALAKTGANSVSIVGSTMQASASANALSRSATDTSLATLGKVIDRAHLDGLSVTLTPHVNLPTLEARTAIVPTNTAAWFKAYTAYIVDYAKTAEAHGAEMLSLGAEMDGVATLANTQYWNDLIAQVRQVYHGKITYQAGMFAANQVGFWDKVDIISVMGYVPVASDGNVTLASAKAAWDAVPLSNWKAATFDGMSPLDFFRSLAVTYNKPFMFGELGYRPGDGGGVSPGDWSTKLTPDAEEQKTLYQAFFEVFGKETSWFKGVNIWEWSDTPSATPKVDYSLQNAPALGLIKDWYAGVHNGLLANTITGTNSRDTLTGGTGKDLLLGGKGSDVLFGGDGNDQLVGDGGNNPLQDKLIVYATGTPAAGVDALMGVRLNGKLLGTYSVPKHADGSFSKFSFDLTPGIAVKSLSLAFVNDARSATEDRNLIVKQVLVNGNSLALGDGVNKVMPGTFWLWSNGSVDFDLTKHPEYSGTAGEKADWLDGGRGDDILTGGGGADTFVFYWRGGHDVVTDFGRNGDRDVLYLPAHTKMGMRPAISAAGADTHLDFADGSQIVLTGVAPSQLTRTSTGYVFNGSSAKEVHSEALGGADGESGAASLAAVEAANGIVSSVGDGKGDTNWHAPGDPAPAEHAQDSLDLSNVVASFGNAAPGTASNDHSVTDAALAADSARLATLADALTGGQGVASHDTDATEMQVAHHDLGSIAATTAAVIAHDYLF
jgi:hypothetical protein